MVFWLSYRRRAIVAARAVVCDACVIECSAAKARGALVAAFARRCRLNVIWRLSDRRRAIVAARTGFDGSRRSTRYEIVIEAYIIPALKRVTAFAEIP
jgi:hypothetical protein